MIQNGKAKIEKTFGELTIIIPSKKNWFALLFATAWLGGWFFGFKTVLTLLFFDNKENSGPEGFMTLWLLAWTIAGLAILAVLLWGYFGRETIKIDKGEIFFEKTVFGIGQKKRMEANEVKNMRTERTDSSWFGPNRWAFWGLGSGKIKFDYGLKTFSFGLGVDDAEANHLVEILKDYLKQ